LYFFDLLKTSPADKILDMGCGTGALLPDLQSLSPAEIYGADYSLYHLAAAKSTCPDCYLVGANVFQLPFADNSFEMVLSHYFMLWVGDPTKALVEMHRITKPGGTIVCFAEPDYGGRIDYPPEFSSLRDYQITALQTAGADPLMGRKLPALFHQGGFTNIQTGIYGGAWKGEPTDAEQESEWLVLEDDLTDLVSPEDLLELKTQDRKAHNNGTRVIYVPTFYAWGQVCKP